MAFSEPRYERKFPLAGHDEASLVWRLRMHPAGFREIYRPRDIHNLYFDTRDYAYYQAHVSGVGERRKVRVRWYDEALGVPVLEFKTRAGKVGQKSVHPLPGLDAARLDQATYWPGLFAAANLPGGVVQGVASLRPVLFNHYRRRYFLSADGLFRVTLDSRLAYRGFGQLLPSAPEPVLVLELKYGVDAEAAAPEVVSQLPFRVDRYSKYVAGVTQCLGHVTTG